MKRPRHRVLRNEWRCTRVLTVVFWLQFLILTAMLGLTGYAYQDTYRTLLRTDGAQNGFNTYPPGSAMALYGPKIEGVEESKAWSQTATTFSLIMSLVSFLILVVQGAFKILDIYPPLLSVIFNIVLITIWMINITIFQAGADVSAGSRPWYITKSCNVAFSDSNTDYCYQAKALFGITIVLLVDYLGIVAWAVWSLVSPPMPEGSLDFGSVKEAKKPTTEDDGTSLKPYLRYSVV